MTGPIPPELGKLINLTDMRLERNQLTGPIPPELGKLTRLTFLWLHENQLTGPISPGLSKLTKLTHFGLNRNQLAGAIPPELGQITNLTGLWLSGNELVGPIPPELGKLTNLTSLSLAENQLDGEIPAELGQPTNLTSLSLGGNQLDGEIPHELGQLTNLTSLSLNENLLTGTIPAKLGRLTDLTSLRLNGNRLTGKLPRGLKRLRLTLLALDPSISGLSPRHRRLVALSTAQPGDKRDEEIAEMIAAGESQTVEFKETLRGLRGDGEPERAVLKNIAGFLNSDGGHLFVGISDNKEACGIEREIEGFEDEEDEIDRFENEDAMRQYLSNIIKNWMTPGTWNRVHPNFHTYSGVRILVIRCDQSPDQVTVRMPKGQQPKVYARMDATTRPLESHEVKPHFDSRTLQPGATESDG